MRFMMIVKASKESEGGAMPSAEMIAAMTKYNEELVNAGILVDLSGLQPSSKGARIQYSGNKVSVIDGPFPETKELIGGFWIINVKSKQEAIDWARRAPNPHGPSADTYIELRQFFELDDFEPSAAVEEARKLGSKLKK